MTLHCNAPRSISCFAVWVLSLSMGVLPTMAMTLRCSCIGFCRASTCMQSSNHESCSSNTIKVGKRKLSA